MSRLHPTLASLAPGFADRMAAAPGFEHVRWDAAETVPVTTLDALIAEHGPPRFVKIDVEGHEAEVLRGLSRPGAVDRLRIPARRARRGGRLPRPARGPRTLPLQPRPRRTLAFALPDWTDAAGLRAALAARAADGRSGDVYARLEPGDAG